MRFDWSTLALQIVNFAILVALLQRFLYRPVLRVIDARRAAVERAQGEAARAAEEASRQRSQLEAQRSGLAAERAAALERARQEAGKLVAGRRAEAERDAAALLEDARATIAREQQQALEEARRTALDLAAGMARRVLAEIPQPLRAQSWLERIDRHLRSLPAAERAGLAGELGGPRALRVVTACSLSAEAQESWRARLRSALGPEASRAMAGAGASPDAPAGSGAIQVVFETEPGLIGGAELRFPHATLSFSMQSAIGTLEKAVGLGDEPR